MPERSISCINDKFGNMSMNISLLRTNNLNWPRVPCIDQCQIRPPWFTSLSLSLSDKLPQAPQQSFNHQSSHINEHCHGEQKLKTFEHPNETYLNILLLQMRGRERVTSDSSLGDGWLAWSGAGAGAQWGKVKS